MNLALTAAGLWGNKKWITVPPCLPYFDHWLRCKQTIVHRGDVNIKWTQTVHWYRHLCFSRKVQFLREHGLEGRRLFFAWRRSIDAARFKAIRHFAIHTSQQASDLHLVSVLVENLCDSSDEWRSLCWVAKCMKTYKNHIRHIQLIWNISIYSVTQSNILLALSQHPCLTMALQQLALNC